MRNQADSSYDIRLDYENSYPIPYHHIPYFDENGVGTLFRTMQWGWEYLCYQKHVEEMAYSLNPSSILEVGCGDGRFIGQFDKHVTRRVGVDRSARAIGFGRVFYPEVEFHRVDAQELNDVFDLVVAISVLEHVPDNEVGDFLKSLVDRMRPGGYLIIQVPTSVRPVHQGHFRHYNIELLQNELAAASINIKSVKVDYIYRNNPVFQLFHRFLHNRHWLIDVYFLRTVMWNYVWNNLRFAEAKNGIYMAALFQKPAGE